MCGQLHVVRVSATKASGQGGMVVRQFEFLKDPQSKQHAGASQGSNFLRCHQHGHAVALAVQVRGYGRTGIGQHACRWQLLGCALLAECVLLYCWLRRQRVVRDVEEAMLAVVDGHVGQAAIQIGVVRQTGFIPG
jgi:hypothetical protein